MDYEELVSKVIELLQREKRVPYRVLKRRFDLDDDYIDDLKIDLIEAKRLAIDENDRILVWIGEAGSADTPPPPHAVHPKTRLCSSHCTRTRPTLLHAQASGRENSHFQECPRRRTQAGDGLVLRSCQLDCYGRAYWPRTHAHPVESVLRTGARGSPPL